MHQIATFGPSQVAEGMRCQRGRGGWQGAEEMAEGEGVAAAQAATYAGSASR